jgi:hypothetical protein
VSSCITHLHNSDCVVLDWPVKRTVQVILCTHRPVHRVTQCKVHLNWTIRNVSKLNRYFLYWRPPEDEDLSLQHVRASKFRSDCSDHMVYAKWQLYTCAMAPLCLTKIVEMWSSSPRGQFLSLPILRPLSRVHFITAVLMLLLLQCPHVLWISDLEQQKL